MALDKNTLDPSISLVDQQSIDTYVPIVSDKIETNPLPYVNKNINNIGGKRGVSTNTPVEKSNQSFTEKADARRESLIGKSYNILETHKSKSSNNALSNLLLPDVYSRYETYLPGGDNETLNAKNQSSASMWSNAATQFVLGLPGGAIGYLDANRKMAKSAMNGDFSSLWDDDVSDQIYKSGEDIRDMFPIYNNADIQEQKGAIGTIKGYLPGSEGSGAKWANVLGNLSYTVATIGGVVAENVIVDAMTGGAAAPVEAAKGIKSIWDSATGLFRTVKNIDKAYETYRALNAAEKVKQYALPMVRFAKNSATAITSEGSVEAYAASMEFKENQTNLFKEKYGREPNEIELKEIEDKSNEVGDKTFIGNVPILATSNFFTFGSALKGGKLFGKLGSDLIEDAVVKTGETALKTAKQVAKEEGKLALAAYWAKRGGNDMFKKNIGEGLEEAGQSIASASAKRYYDIYGDKKTESYLDAIKYSAFDDKDLNLWEDWWSGVIVGGIMGGAGVVSNRGKSQKIVDAYNKSSEENLKYAVESLGRENEIPGNLGNKPLVSHENQTRQLIGGAVSFNAALGQSVADTKGNEKEYHDFRDESLKQTHYNNFSNGKSSAGKEIFNNFIQSIPEQEYAKTYMDKADASKEEVELDKHDRQVKFAEGQDSFDKAFKDINFRYKNKYDRSENPLAWEAYEAVKRDIAFYAYDADSSIKRHGQVLSSMVDKLSEYNKTSKDESISLADLDVLSSTKARETKMATLRSEIDAHNLVISNAADESIVSQEKKSLGKAQEKLNILQNLANISKESQINIIPTTEQKKSYILAVNDYMKNLTGASFGESHPIHNLTADLLDLENEASYFTTLYNSLLGNQAFFDRYHFGYTKEMLAQHNKYKAKFAATASKKEDVAENIAPSDSIIEGIKKEFNVANVSDIKKDDIQAKIDQLSTTPSAENVEIAHGYDWALDQVNKKAEVEKNKPIPLEVAEDSLKKEELSLEIAKKAQSVATSNQSETPKVEEGSGGVVGDVNIIDSKSDDIIAELNKLKATQEKLNWLKEKGLITPIVINGKSYNSIDYNDRIIVLAKIGKYNIPFYISTGQAGKKNVKAGNWYAIFGIGESGWINKGSEELINKQYDFPVFQKIAKILNEGVGSFESRENNGNGKIIEGIGYLEDSKNAISDFNAQMGLPITPAKNNTESKVFYENVNNVLNLVNDELKNVTQSLKEISQSEIEAKKADIERRRQEELEKIATDIFPNTKVKQVVYHGTPNKQDDFFVNGESNNHRGWNYFFTTKGRAEDYGVDVYSVIVNSQANLKDNMNDDVIDSSGLISNPNVKQHGMHFGLLLEDSAYFFNHGADEVVVKNKEQIHILNEEELNRIDEINKKYDAELKALNEQKTTIFAEHGETNEGTVDRRDEDLASKILANERRKEAREERRQWKEARQKVKDFLADSVELEDKVKLAFISGQKLTKEAMREFFKSGLERKVRFGWMNPKGSRSLDGFGESAILELPESLQETYSPSEITGAVEDILTRFTNNTQIYKYVIGQINGQEDEFERMNRDAKRVYEEGEMSEGLVRHINELIDKAVDILNPLTSEEIETLKEYLKEVTSTPFTTNEEDERADAIKKALDIRGIAYQKSSNEDTISLEGQAILGKIFNVAFPGIVKMGDEEAFDNIGGSRMQIIGETDAEILDKIDNVSLRIESLNTAKEMFTEGVSADKIKDDTGWELLNGQWKLELPYLNIKDGFKFIVNKEYPLSDIIEDGDVKKIYKDLKIIFKDEEIYYAGEAAYNPSMERIEMGAKNFPSFDARETVKDRGFDSGSDFRQILVHEIQHHAQRVNRFYRGGNAETAISEARRIVNENGSLRDLEDAIRKVERASKTAKQNKLLDAVLDYLTESDILTASEKRFSLYRNLAGEVESRIAERRMDLPDLFKQAASLEDSADVSKEDRIYIESEIDDIMNSIAPKRMPIGMVSGGKVWFNSERESLDTRMHEYGGHIFFAYAKNKMPGLYNKIMAKYDDIPQSVKNFVKENYPEHREGSELFKDEVVATYMGQINKDGVLKAIKSNGIKADIARIINKIYQTILRRLGFKNYLSVDKFNDMTMGEMLQYVGEGILNGKVSSNITSDDLAKIMSESPLMMKNVFEKISTYLEKIKGYSSAVKSALKLKRKPPVVRNKTIGEKVSIFIPSYSYLVNIDNVSHTNISPDDSKFSKLIKYINESSIEDKKILPNASVDAISIIHYSDGIANIFSKEDIMKLKSRNIGVLDTSISDDRMGSDGYARGRIIVFKTKPNGNSLAKDVLELTGIEMSEKYEYKPLRKGGVMIKSNSDLYGKINRDAQRAVKSGDALRLEVEFNSKWNQSILNGLKEGNRNDYSDTLVVSIKNESGDTVGFMRATADILEDQDVSENDNDQKERKKRSGSKEKHTIKAIRNESWNMLKNAERENSLKSKREIELEKMLENESISESEKEGVLEEIEKVKANASLADIDSIKVGTIKAKGVYAHFNLIESPVPVSEFLDKNEGFVVGYYAEDSSGTPMYVGQDGKQLNIKPRDKKKQQTAYLLGEGIESRLIFEKGVSSTTLSEFKELDLSSVFTQIDPNSPFSDISIRLDYDISENLAEVSNEEVVALGEQENSDISQEQREETFGKDIISDVVTDNELEKIEEVVAEPQAVAAPKMTKLEERLVMNFIPAYYQMPYTDEQLIGENREAYSHQKTMVNMMNDIFNKRGLKFTEAWRLSRNRFKNLLTAVDKYLRDEINFKAFVKELYTIKNNGGRIDIQSMNIFDLENAIAPEPTRNSKVIKIVGDKPENSLLLSEYKDLIVRHLDSDFYFVFQRSELGFEADINNAFSEIYESYASFDKNAIADKFSSVSAMKDEYINSSSKNIETEIVYTKDIAEENGIKILSIVSNKGKQENVEDLKCQE